MWKRCAQPGDSEVAAKLLLIGQLLHSEPCWPISYSSSPPIHGGRGVNTTRGAVLTGLSIRKVEDHYYQCIHTRISLYRDRIQTGIWTHTGAITLLPFHDVSPILSGWEWVFLPMVPLSRVSHMLPVIGQMSLNPSMGNKELPLSLKPHQDRRKVVFSLFVSRAK